MKKFLTIIALLAFAAPAFANNAPPQLNLNIQIPAEEEEDAPPALNLNIQGVDQEPQGQQNNGNNNNNNQQDDDISIVSHSIVPSTLNPMTSSSLITYRLEGSSKVDVKIYNGQNQLVQTLIANKLHGPGEYQVKWYGTVSGQQGGTPLDVGAYNYKIIAKDPANNDTEDSATGNMRIQYSVANQPAGVMPPVNNTPSGSDLNAAAMLANQNRTSGRTSETGPALLIYGALPLAYLIRKNYGTQK